jgi:hypothetical protein
MIVEKRHLRSLVQQRKKFWPAKCRVFRVLLKDDGQNFFLEISPNCNFSRLGGLYRAPKFLKLKRNIYIFFFLGLEGRPPTRGARGGAFPVPKPTK